MNSAEYEKTVSDLVAALVRSVDGLPPEHIRSRKINRITGASGYAHQIDVSIQARTELHVIECKCWKRRVTGESVLTLLGRIHDIQAANPSLTVRGALATTKGFQRGAEKVASHYGILLQFVQSPSEFALRYKDRVHLGVADQATCTDSVFVEVCPAPPEDPGSLNPVA
jgi:hypothetical protein